jgi:phosphotransferase system HPr (HPr) family protein
MTHGQSVNGSAGPIRRTIRVTNPLGLHYRVADRLARAAKGFQAVVTVYNGELRADAKSLWDLLGLVVLPGAEVVLEVDGPDAADAVDPLADILAAPGGEDYTI